MDREPPVIRAARPADSRQIARIQVDSYRTAFDPLLPKSYLDGFSYAEQERDWSLLLGSQHRPLLIVAALADSELAGYALCEPETEIAGFTSELVALHVLPECQGWGLGRSLVSAAAEILASQGHQSVYLWTLADNPARSIYEKWGGEYLARRPWSNNVYFGTQIEEVAYGWPDIKVLIGLAMGAH